MEQPHLTDEAFKRQLAVEIFKAHTLATSPKEGPDLALEDFEDWYRTNARMPLSGPGFVRVWEACADAVLSLFADHMPAAEASDEKDMPLLVKALVILARRGIPADIQELLVQGNPSRGVAPGALDAVLQCAGNAEVK